MFEGGLSDVHLIKSVSVTAQKQSSPHLIILFTSSLIVIASVWNPPGCTWLFIVFLLDSFVFQERHVSSKVKLLGEGRKCSYHRRGKLLFFQHRHRITASLVADAPHPHRNKPQKPFYLLSFIHCQSQTFHFILARYRAHLSSTIINESWNGNGKKICANNIFKSKISVIHFAFSVGLSIGEQISLPLIVTKGGSGIFTLLLPSFTLGRHHPQRVVSCSCCSPTFVCCFLIVVFRMKLYLQRQVLIVVAGSCVDLCHS